MESLRFVERDNVKWYCFIEASVTLFPGTPKSTVRGWLKPLGIQTAVSTAEERTYFKNENPYLSGLFGLIQHDDLLRLITYRNEKSPSKIRRSNTSSTTSSTTSATAVPNNQVCLVTYEYSSSEEEVWEHKFPSAKSQQTIACGKNGWLPTISSRCKENSENKNDLATTSSATGFGEDSTQNDATEQPRDRSKYQLRFAEAPEDLKCEVKSIRQFYVKTINPKRTTSNFSETTVEKMVERIMCFMFYCKTYKNIERLSLSLYDDETLVSDYLKFLTDVRKQKPSTLTSILTVAINVVKYNLRDGGRLAINNSSQIDTYRSYQRQFAKENRILSKRKREGLTDKGKTEFYFEHVLEVIDKLRDKYFESVGLEKARYLHDFVLLVLYSRAMPGRSQEIRTLQLFLESEVKLFNYSEWNSGNVIVFHLDNRVVLLECDHKTSKSSGPTKLDLSDDGELVSFLEKYVKSSREKLMQGKAHNNFFLNHHGEAFRDSAAIAKYFGDLFEREISMRVSTTALRHAIVTYFLSMDESKDVNVRESLAALMKHSVRYQESVYNDLTHDQKTKQGRNLLRDKMASGVFGDRDEIVEDDENSSDSSSEEFELKPNTGDICALLDGASTPENVEFFLAKVARFSDDRKEAHLIHLERSEGSENVYRSKPGRVWTESVEALIFPLDVVYNTSERVYELRTSAEEIYNFVHRKKT